MHNIEQGKLYKLSEIIAETELPFFIRKELWSADFVFRVEKIKNEIAYGTAFKNGVEYRRRYGEYSYGLSEQFYLIDIPKKRSKQSESEYLAEIVSEMKAEKRESDAVLAQLSISDVVHTRGQVTERAFLANLFSEDHQGKIENEEKTHIARIIQIIERLISKIRSFVTMPERPLWPDIEVGPGGSLINLSANEYFSENDRNTAYNVDVATLQQIEKKPYFCHISLQFEDEDAMTDVFIGEKVVYDSACGNEHPTVISWQSQIGSLAYNKTQTSITLRDNCRANVQFKRNVVIQEGLLSSVVETYNRSRKLNEREEAIVYDKFLLKVLEEKRQHNELTNIIPSIQQNQNQIIRAPQKEHLIVQGCAGCGKTMILLHRISYLLYTYRDISQSSFLILSPSRRFNKYLQPLLSDLRISNITVKSVPEYYIECLYTYNPIWRELIAEERLYSDANIDSKTAQYFYSREYAQKLSQRVKLRIEALHNNERTITQLLEQRAELKKTGRDTRQIDNEINQLKLRRRISIYDEQFLDVIPDGVNPGNRKKPICRAELYATLLVNFYCYGTRNTFPYVFIDEGQDLSIGEYLLISSLNNKPIFNIYGDLDQRVSNSSVASWDDLRDVGTFSKYSINENYRNTMQITEFVNSELFKNMVGMGIEGAEVDLKPISQIRIERQIASFGDRKAIIYKDKSALDSISIKEDLTGYEVYTVREAKGMEFETVLVIPNHMTDNELYIAYTRALNRLFLLDV